MYKYTYIHTYLQVYIYICIHTHIYTYTSVCIGTLSSLPGKFQIFMLEYLLVLMELLPTPV